MSLCQRSSFSAENTPITVIPAFSSSQAPLTVSSSPHQRSVGPFVAGMPVVVPLWMAKILHRKSLAQIQLPDWLALDNLKAMLQEEKTSESLTSHLPFYYYEIARYLTNVLNQGGSDGAGQQQAALVVLQDLVAVRIDKIRQHFHELSRETLVHVEDDLPMIAVPGIASVELNRIGPFLQRAFADHGYLIQRSKDDDDADGSGEVSSGLGGEGIKASSSGLKEPSKGGASHTIAKKTAVARSRIRRFRQ